MTNDDHVTIGRPLVNVTEYIVDADMNLRGSWPTDSLPMSDSTRWLSDTTMLETTTCNGIYPTQYTHTFTLTEEDLQ